MGGSASCFSLCAADDSQTPNSAIPETARWCVDDSAVEEVFIPDAGVTQEEDARNTFIVVGLEGASVRDSVKLDSTVLKMLPRSTKGHLKAVHSGERRAMYENSRDLIVLNREGETRCRAPVSVVTVSEVKGRRAHIVKPLDGWASLRTEDGYVIIDPIKRSTKYKVIYEDGVVIRSAAKIEEGDFVTLAPYASVLKATGKTEVIDGVERVQVEGGWASMRLREDRGQGARLLVALD